MTDFTTKWISVTLKRTWVVGNEVVDTGPLGTANGWENDRALVPARAQRTAWTKAEKKGPGRRKRSGWIRAPRPKVALVSVVEAADLAVCLEKAVEPDSIRQRLGVA